jgi:hypothetical protein
MRYKYRMRTPGLELFAFAACISFVCVSGQVANQTILVEGVETCLEPSVSGWPLGYVARWPTLKEKVPQIQNLCVRPMFVVGIPSVWKNNFRKFSNSQSSPNHHFPFVGTRSPKDMTAFCADCLCAEENFQNDGSMAVMMIS